MNKEGGNIWVNFPLIPLMLMKPWRVLRRRLRKSVTYLDAGNKKLYAPLLDLHGCNVETCERRIIVYDCRYWYAAKVLSWSAKCVGMSDWHEGRSKYGDSFNFRELVGADHLAQLKRQESIKVDSLGTYNWIMRMARVWVTVAVRIGQTTRTGETFTGWNHPRCMLSNLFFISLPSALLLTPNIRFDGFKCPVHNDTDKWLFSSRQDVETLRNQQPAKQVAAVLSIHSLKPPIIFSWETSVQSKGNTELSELLRLEDRLVQWWIWYTNVFQNFFTGCHQVTSWRWLVFLQSAPMCRLACLSIIRKTWVSSLVAGHGPHCALRRSLAICLDSLARRSRLYGSFISILFPSSRVNSHENDLSLWELGIASTFESWKLL